MKTKHWILMLSLVLGAGCASSTPDPIDEPGDGPDDVFLMDGKADTGGVVEGTPDALGVLKLVNEASESELDIDAALDRRAAGNIVYYRSGDDEQAGTSDDEKFDTLAELDAVPYVGPVAFRKLLAYAKAHGYVSTGGNGGGNGGGGTTVVIGPPDLRGWIDVSVPAQRLADWSPASPERYGPSSSLAYNNGVYHVFSGSTKVASSDVGNRVFLPKGAYTVVMNDTKRHVTVDAQQTVEVKAGRLEVADVAGLFDITAAAGDFSNGSQVLDASDIPTGVGMNLMPGRYTISVRYQSHTKGFEVDIDNGELELVNPDELRGFLRVEPPSGARLPDWAPASAPTFGPSNQHRYDSFTFHVYSGSTHLHSGDLGEEFRTPEGSYVVAMNDTKTTVSVDAMQTTVLEASRIEVEDVDGTYSITAPNGDFSNGSQVLDESEIPTGTGINVMPGTYRVDVAYQAHTKTFQVNVAAGETFVVRPNDLRGYLVVEPPTGMTLPDWSPSNPPAWGPSSRHRYDQNTYHVYSGSTYLASVAVGQPYLAPEGHYIIALNDTKYSMQVTAGGTTTVRLGRIEVNDVDGTVSITAPNGDFSNGTQVMDVSDIPTGVGVNVLPGHYRVDVAYQTHSNTFEVDIR